MGKGGDVLASLVHKYNKPCICIGGKVSERELKNFDGLFSISTGPDKLERLIKEAGSLIERLSL